MHNKDKNKKEFPLGIKRNPKNILKLSWLSLNLVRQGYIILFWDRKQIRIGETVGVTVGNMGRELEGSAGISENGGINATISYSNTSLS